MAKAEDLNDKLQKLGKEEFKKQQEAIQEVDALESMLSDSNITNLEDKSGEIYWINKLNKDHIFINTLGGKNFITHNVYNDVTRREELEFIQLDTFKNIYRNKTLQTLANKAGIDIGTFWIGDSRRMTVESIIFDPKAYTDPPKTLHERIIEVNNKKYLNMWDGFITSKPKTKWPLTKRHIYRILCNSNPVKFKYFIKWLAWLVQNRDDPAEVAVIFKGEKGAGKSFIFSQFQILFGRSGMTITDPARLAGKFSHHFQNLIFLFCDEVYYPGDKEIEGRVKAIITEKHIDVESKFKDAITIKNRLHIAMCTNNEWVVPAGKGERRYFIESTNNKYAKDNSSEAVRKKYFDALWKEMQNGGREAMLHDLMNYDLKDWHPRNDVPETDEMKKQKTMSLNPLQQALKTMLEDGLFPGEYSQMSYFVTSETLENYLHKLEPYSAKFSNVRKATAYKELGAVKGRMPKGGRIRWEFPELQEMRKNFDKAYGQVGWDDIKKWNIIKSDF